MKIGRPHKYLKIVEEILRLRDMGMTYREIEAVMKPYGISKATAQRIVGRASGGNAKST